MVSACITRVNNATREANAVRSDSQPGSREGQAGPWVVAERFVVVMKPGNSGGAKGPQFQDNARSSKGPKMIGQDSTPGPTNSQKVQKLQAALHTKAKESPKFRFYALHDKVYRADVLHVAYEQCRKNGGAPGVDGQSFADIEAYGVEKWLGELAEEVRTKRYEPQAVRRVWIAKADGGKRPLGIPTIKDRVVQTAVLLILGPIFEADLPAEQHAYRAGKSALEAVQEVHRLICYGHSEVVDADLSDYFGSIPHAELMQCVARRVSDSRVLALVKAWLVAPVEEQDERGNTQRTTRNKDEGRGTQQGSPISPLLANLYMRRFILGWKQLGHETQFQARIVNYADDFVILCRRGADQALLAMRSMMQRLKLTVNEKKTRVCKLPESFDFLGYTIGPYWSWVQRRMVLSTRPSAKSRKRIKAAIRRTTRRSRVLLDVKTIVKELNRKLRGWANYFCRGPVSEAYRDVDRHTQNRLRQWLGGKHKQSGLRHDLYPNELLQGKLGLLQLTSLPRNVPWAKGCGQ
jgi:RNA-directed DNA polymerase